MEEKQENDEIFVMTDEEEKEFMELNPDAVFKQPMILWLDRHNDYFTTFKQTQEDEEG